MGMRWIRVRKPNDRTVCVWVMQIPTRTPMQLSETWNVASSRVYLYHDVWLAQNTQAAICAVFYTNTSHQYSHHTPMFECTWVRKNKVRFPRLSRLWLYNTRNVRARRSRMPSPVLVWLVRRLPIYISMRRKSCMLASAYLCDLNWNEQLRRSKSSRNYTKQYHGQIGRVNPWNSLCEPQSRSTDRVWSTSRRRYNNIVITETVFIKNHKLNHSKSAILPKNKNVKSV